MPIFTVIVKDARTNRTKEVTVNTDGMVATVVNDVDDEKEEYMRQQQQGLPVSATSSVEPVVESAAEEEPPVGLENVRVNVGGKRSIPSFRLKKRRLTRKLEKTR